METPKPEAIFWASFAWLVIKEVPEAFWAYIVLLDKMRARRRRPRTVDLGKTAVFSSSTLTGRQETRPAFLELAPAHGKATTRMELTTGRPLELSPIPLGKRLDRLGPVPIDQD